MVAVSLDLEILWVCIPPLSICMNAVRICHLSLICHWRNLTYPMWASIQGLRRGTITPHQEYCFLTSSKAHQFPEQQQVRNVL